MIGVSFQNNQTSCSSNCWFCLEMFKIQHQGIHIILDWSWYYETCRLRDGARNGIKLFFSSTFQINPIFRYKGFLSCSKNSSFDVHPVLMGLINQNLILIIAKITKQWNSPFHNHSSSIIWNAALDSCVKLRNIKYRRKGRILDLNKNKDALCNSIKCEQWKQQFL